MNKTIALEREFIDQKTWQLFKQPILFFFIAIYKRQLKIHYLLTSRINKICNCQILRQSFVSARTNFTLFFLFKTDYHSEHIWHKGCGSAHEINGTNLTTIIKSMIYCRYMHVACPRSTADIVGRRIEL